MTTEYKRWIIASRNSKTCCFGRDMFGSFSTKARTVKRFFLTATSVVAVMQVRKGLNQNDTISLER